MIVSSDAGWASSDVLGPARPAQAALNSCSGPQSLDWRPGTGSQRRGETPEIVGSDTVSYKTRNVADTDGLNVVMHQYAASPEPGESVEC